MRLQQTLKSIAVVVFFTGCAASNSAEWSSNAGPASPEPGSPQAEAKVPTEHEGNTGQDPTNPVTRVDARYKLQDAVGESEAHTFTLRADKPFELDGGWKLSTRVDLPFLFTHDTPDDSSGLSDTLIQALAVSPEHEHWAYVWGAQVIFPTASEDELGTGRYQLVPTVGAIRQLPDVRPGSFAGALLRNQFSFAGDDDRSDINDLVLQPVLNITLPKRWFTTIAPEMRFDLTDGGRAFIPLDLTVGRKITHDVIVSIQIDAPIVDDYAQYEGQIEFRIGFFF